MRECTHCPPNTKQCAHLDGHWVRLTVGPDCVNPDGVPAVVWNFKPGDRYAMSFMFYHPPSSLSDAEENFGVLNVIMRKIASRVPGDVCT